MRGSEGPGRIPLRPGPLPKRTSTMASLIEFKDAQLGYGRDIGLRDVNLQINRGDFLGIVGPLGSRKTTLIRTFLGLLRQGCGTVAVQLVLHFGYVPQRETVDTLFPIPVE